MDENIKYNDVLEDISDDLLVSLDCSDLPFDLKGRKLQVVLITYIFDNFSSEVTEIEF